MVKFTFSPRENCTVEAYLHTSYVQGKTLSLPSILICPGGAYEIVSWRESEPVAMKYYAAHYNAFVLNYSVGTKSKNFEPLLDLAASIAHIRRHAEEYGVNPTQIAVCGFSAGGHLAASLGTLYDEEKFLRICPELGNIRPDAMVLSYPVICADEFANVCSISNVSGAEAGSEEYRWFGLEQHVKPSTPPAFLWHTANDDCVPVENSLRFATALSAAKVPFELHIYPDGPHGLSVCTAEVENANAYVGRWVEESLLWLNRAFLFTP